MVESEKMDWLKESSDRRIDSIELIGPYGMTWIHSNP